MDALPGIELFVDALPAWRMGEVATEGFSRSDVLALMDLRGIPHEERAAAWDGLSDMENEYRKIRINQCRQKRALQSKSMPMAQSRSKISTK